MLSDKRVSGFLSILTCLACNGCATALPPNGWKNPQPAPPTTASVQPASTLRITGAPAAENQPIATSQPQQPPAAPAVRDAAPPASPVSHDTGPALNPAVPAIVPESPANSVSADSLTNLRRLYRQAADCYARIDSYNARLRRREQVNGKNKPEEIIFFRFRKEPWSVYMKWIGPTGNGREMTYVKGQYENKLHTLLAAGDNILFKAGSRFSLLPDSPLIRNESRHSIMEAGVGNLVEKFGNTVAAAERGDRALNVRYVGQVRRPEFKVPVECVQNDVPTGFDPQLPHGGRRYWHFDPASHLPVLLITLDERGQEVEYYCYDLLQYPVKLDDRDFNPDVLWPKKP